MAVKDIIRCVNYEDHLVYIQKHALNSIHLLIRETSAIHYQWQRINGEWLCPHCLEEMGIETE